MDTKKPASTAQKNVGDFAPKLAELTDDVLFGDVWERPQLSKRDRSLITCAALVATGKTEQMSFHFPRALENGVTREELDRADHPSGVLRGLAERDVGGRRAKEVLGNSWA